MTFTEQKAHAPCGVRIPLSVLKTTATFPGHISAVASFVCARVVTVTRHDIQPGVARGLCTSEARGLVRVYEAFPRLIHATAHNLETTFSGILDFIVSQNVRIFPSASFVLCIFTFLALVSLIALPAVFSYSVGNELIVFCVWLPCLLGCTRFPLVFWVCSTWSAFSSCRSTVVFT